MAFKSQSECPRCGGQLQFNYETLRVQCDHCASVFTVEEISNYVNKSRSSEIEKGSVIYDKERYDEVLTTKNVENINNEALKKRMKIALVTERYDELSRYIDEMIRREPDNTLPYEYALLMRYKVFHLEELENVDAPFYHDDEYRIMKRIGDRFKVEELEALEKNARRKAEERRQQALKEKEAWEKQVKKDEMKSQILSVFLIILAFLPTAFAVVFVLIAGLCNAQLAFLEKGTLVYTGLLAYAGASIGVAILLTKKKANDELDDGKSKAYFSLVGVLLVLGIVLGAILVPKADYKFNPAEDILMTATRLTDDVGYDEYETTVYFTVYNNSNYTVEGFKGTVSFSKNGSSIGTWDVNFSGGYAKNSEKDIYVKFRSSHADLYNSTFEELTIKYKIQSITKDLYNQGIECDCTEKYAKQ